jgi:hypothetical protein
LCAFCVFVSNTTWLHFILTKHGDWYNRLLDRMIQASAVGAAFWGLTLTLLIMIESKSIVVNLKRIRYFRFVVEYFAESLFTCVFLLISCVAIEPLSKRIWPEMLTSVWAAFVVWSLLSSMRSYLVLTQILYRASEQ